MKTIGNLFMSLKSGNKQKGITKVNFIFFLFVSLFTGQQAVAQNTTDVASISDKVNYWVLGAFCFVFSAAVIYALNGAVKVLKENGKTVEMSFPMIKNMANNGKVVAILIALIVAAGIFWAVKFG